VRFDYKDIDVLGLIKWDWANSGYRFTQSLKMLDLNAVSFKGTPLAYFNYPEQLPTLPILSEEPVRMYPILNDVKHDTQLQDLIMRSKVIYLFGTQMIENINIPSNTKMVVQHGGRTYREAAAQCNKIFNPLVDATIAQCPDLLNLGAKNEHLIYYPVDTELIKPDYVFKDPAKLIIGHFPSNPTNKGTEIITAVIKKLKESSLGDKFEYNGIPWLGNQHKKAHFVDWPDNLKRLNTSDIIIETCKPSLNGKPFGEWGNTAIEGSASGKIVVTNSLTAELYAKEYGNTALQINDGTPEGLEKSLVALLTMPREKILQRKKEARRWVVEKHSIDATALRLWEKIFKHLFPNKWTEEGLKRHIINTWTHEYLQIKGWNKQ